MVKLNKMWNFLEKLRRFFSYFRLNPLIAIDLGTANTLIYVKNKGIVSREPSLLSINIDNKHTPIAVGNRAKLMIGKTPNSIKVIKPMKEGVVSDFDYAQIMLNYFIKQAVGKSIFPYYPLVVICVPYGATPVEKRVIKDAVVGDVTILYEPIAAALGADLKIEEANGNMIVDIGGGTTELAILSLGGIVSAKSIRIAGDSIDRAIMDSIKNKYNIGIGINTAEEIKIKFGTLVMDDDNKQIILVSGKDLTSGLPKELEIILETIYLAIKSQFVLLSGHIQELLEGVSPEVSSDIQKRGIYLCGGGAITPGSVEYLKKLLNLPVFVAENPLDCVVKGAGIFLEKYHNKNNTIICE